MVVCVFCVLCTLHNTQRTLFINVTLAMLKCKLPDDGRRPKHVGAVLI